MVVPHGVSVILLHPLLTANVDWRNILHALSTHCVRKSELLVSLDKIGASQQFSHLLVQVVCLSKLPPARSTFLWRTHALLINKLSIAWNWGNMRIDIIGQ